MWVFASFPAGVHWRLLEAQYEVREMKWLDRDRCCCRTDRHRQPDFLRRTGRHNMVTKQEDAFIVKNLIALAAVELFGGAIALGMTFHLF